MNERLRSLVWIVLAALVLPGPVYFALRATDASFVSSAMADYFATVMGIVVGVPVAIEIGRRQQAAQDTAAAASRIRRENEWLASILSRVYLEVADNNSKAQTLQTVLSMSDKPPRELWTWIASISDSFSTTAYRDLDASELARTLMPPLSSALHGAYFTTEYLTHKVREAEAAYSYYIRHAPDLYEADQLMRAVRGPTIEMIRNTQEALQELRSASQISPAQAPTIPTAA